MSRTNQPPEFIVGCDPDDSSIEFLFHLAEDPQFFCRYTELEDDADPDSLTIVINETIFFAFEFFDEIPDPQTLHDILTRADEAIARYSYGGGDIVSEN